MPVYKIIQFGLVAMELTAFITGALHWRKVRDTFWRWLVFYLALIVICETTGMIMLYQFKHADLSRGFYNYFVIPFEFLFFFWLYYQYFKTGKKKYWPLYGAAIYALSWAINLLLFNKINFWSIPFSYMMGIVVLLGLIMIFFFNFISGNEILWYKQNMMFWISLGLLLFYLVSSPFFGLRLVLYNNHRNIFWIYYYLEFGVNFLMYIFFSMAFIWGKPH